MRVLWVSNAPWCATGYGTQTAQVVTRMAADGHRVAVAANYGLAGRRSTWNNIRVYPSGWEPWSNDVIPAHAADWMDDDPTTGWTVTLMDAWVFSNPLFQRMNVASWVPVDHHPTPPAVVRWFRNYGAVPIAMSRFGADALRADGLDPLYVPHAVDTTTFRPTPVLRDAPSRRAFGLPEQAFVVGMVANNKGRTPIRKGFDQAFLAFAGFRARHEDAVLYVHADRHGSMDGVDLERLADACGVPSDALFFPDAYAYRQGFPDQVMAALYSSFDVLLAPSKGEGFGIPVIEAQACGVPVIVTDYTAQPELVGAGWTVEYRRDWDEMQASWWAFPLPESIYTALTMAYSADAAERSRLSSAARRFAEQYDADLVYAEHWRPVLAQLEQRLPSADPISVPAVDLGAVA